MMDSWFYGLVSAFWFGVLTSVSPCPLASNIAAVSYIGRRVESPMWVFLYGVWYTAGRVVCYLGLGFLLVKGLLAIPGVSFGLQQYMPLLLGPILVVTGMFLLELLTLPPGGGRGAEWLQRRADMAGAMGAFLLGFVFALAFCPVSAALFFGSLIPLGVHFQSGIAFPAVYGLGTGAPVLVFAFILAFGANQLNRAFQWVTEVEWWTRRITGVIFLAVGLYFCLAFNLALFG